MRLPSLSLYFLICIGFDHAKVTICFIFPNFTLSLHPHCFGGGIGRHAGLKSVIEDYLIECLKGNFESRTPLTNGNLACRNTGFGDGSLNSALLINGVETIQGGPKRKCAWSRNSPDYNGLALRMKPACVKARVARKSRGQQCPYGFDSRPKHIGQFLGIARFYKSLIKASAYYQALFCVVWFCQKLLVNLLVNKLTSGPNMPVKFYLFTRPDKQGDHPINVSISLFGERLCTSIGYGISPSKWDEATQRCNTPVSVVRF